MKNTFVTLAIIAFASLAGRASAAPITFTFQENGSNTDLGTTSTFVESGYQLTASGFLTAGGTTHLYAKSQGPIDGSGEIGLGTTSDPSGEHEITVNNFVQLTLPTMPASMLNLLFLGSVQNGESAKIYYNTVAGTLTGAVLISTVANADGSVAIPAMYQNGYIDITAGSKNVLLRSAQFSTVPEAGFTSSLLGVGLMGLFALRRRLSA